MTEIDKKIQKTIPSSKVQRVSRFVKVGAKVSTNYIKHYAKTVLDNDYSGKEELHKENATDVYEALSELKGSALKVAQMMSMDKNMLPQAYIEKFQMSQYSAPPLSLPLVNKTFIKSFGKAPYELFDTFTKEAVNAASIGQVHLAEKDGKKYAVKVQYPGVAESVSSDLKLVKPIAVRMMGLNEQDVNHYMKEVEVMLLSETDYELELQRSQKITEACKHIKNIYFPNYYKEYSSQKILTMDWLEGKHLNEFLETNPSQEIRNKVGQALWDFYDFQVHQLKEVHADPHPGNFIISEDGLLGIIDFGCVKEIPSDFYRNYFDLMIPENMNNEEKRKSVFASMRFIYDDDSESDKQFLDQLFKSMISILARPFHHDTFDFGEAAYFEEIQALAENQENQNILRKSKKPRGIRDGLYLNRTYFGLYSILHQLEAEVKTDSIFFK
ncbi:AarF/ABC1/UbiB kinase family protein [Flammeovirga yaeyamensis]|uniref:AarF/ABC1/UbiB kinase family protein n=1 Tax=Flammeovirga yaeyamensis TaxID=367791 RepID=A0AAX1NCC9_9BACT|nr:lipopolysaccharide core heptose(II) kinase RfaY [Flammeovirga yaeyamensis]MBB3698860.1 putative unusual protein kinase regulating ubiquinone biosynthesis (AarF/ABC1/UbiB family) [Flammeovirga yaeyamensis]NMF37445.1 AarF/ABC1/UbiB kinase family protein [Flammeovirga yaeyamensis]QWG03742.1 AarF/ABC1/UbiB kinase family protein [Flammeovirga yaeyamensis]